MATRRNGIWYEGRIINNNGQSGLKRAKSGKLVLQLLIAEQFQARNDRAPDNFKDATKAATDYVNTFTAWHKINVYGDADSPEMMALVTDPLFNHGAVVVVDAVYEEQKPWMDKKNQMHAGRQESIFLAGEDGGVISIKALGDDRILGARDEHAVAMWDGMSELPSMGGGGGGGPAAPEYADDEGF